VDFVLYELSDHLPTFFIEKHSKCVSKSTTKFKGCMKKFILEDFLTNLSKNLSEINFDSTSDVNTDVSNVTYAFKSILDEHAPLRLMSKSEKRLSNKPWINTGILKSIKTKNKLFRTVFKSNDSSIKAFYKKYPN